MVFKNYNQNDTLIIEMIIGYLEKSITKSNLVSKIQIKIQ